MSRLRAAFFAAYLNDGRDDPAGVGQPERDEQVDVDLVPQAAHLPEKLIWRILIFEGNI